jgi:hypothetical protein
MNSRVLRLQEINLNKINYFKIKNLDNKKQVYIDYENKPLVFQCPTLLNDNLPIKITDDYYELEIPLITQEKNKQNSLIDFLKNLDSKIVEDANNNVNLWFNENNMSYFFKTIVKDSEKYKKGVIKLKIIKTIKFESILLENNKQININDVLKDWWVKILLEIHSIIINNENKTFYLFLRPHVFSFKDKQIKSNYNFLEDSDSNEEIPDSDIHNLFLKQTKNNKSNEKQTSSQINYNLKQLDLMSKNNLSLTSSENKILDSKESSPESEKETLKKSDSEEKSLSDSKKESLSDSKKENLSDSKKENLSDSEEDSLTESDEESLKKLSDSEESLTESEEESLKKLSDFEETSSESEEETLKKISESEEETLKKLSDSEESIKNKNKKENDNLQNSITLTALLERDNFK